MDPTPHPPPGDHLEDVTPFSVYVAQARGGALDSEATTALAEVVRAVTETGKPGTVTLTIKVAPPSEHVTEMVTVTEKITGRPPKLDKPSLWYVLPGGGLSRRSPNQMDLFTRDPERTPE